MGITVNKSFTTPAGVDVPSHYISLGESRIEIIRPPELPTPLGQEAPARTYNVECSFNIWVSKAARDANKSIVGGVRVCIESATPVTGNVYEALYEKLKEGLTDYTEDI